MLILFCLFVPPRWFERGGSITYTQKQVAGSEYEDCCPTMATGGVVRSPFWLAGPLHLACGLQDSHEVSLLYCWFSTSGLLSHARVHGGNKRIAPRFSQVMADLHQYKAKIEIPCLTFQGKERPLAVLQSSVRVCENSTACGSGSFCFLMNLEPRLLGKGVWVWLVWVLYSQLGSNCIWRWLPGRHLLAVRFLHCRRPRGTWARTQSCQEKQFVPLRWAQRGAKHTCSWWRQRNNTKQKIAPYEWTGCKATMWSRTAHTACGTHGLASLISVQGPSQPSTGKNWNLRQDLTIGLN